MIPRLSLSPLLSLSFFVCSHIGKGFVWIFFSLLRWAKFVLKKKKTLTNPFLFCLCSHSYLSEEFNINIINGPETLFVCQFTFPGNNTFRKKGIGNVFRLTSHTKRTRRCLMVKLQKWMVYKHNIQINIIFINF